jgi:hypothetical protein
MTTSGVFHSTHPGFRCAQSGLLLNESLSGPSFRAELDCLGVAAAAGYGKPWIAFARQKFTGSGFDERSNHFQ